MTYGRNRVDGLKAGSATQDMDTKYYGVTVGYDRRLTRGTAGVALNLGKYESDGKGQWSGASNEGKYIGVGLYGGTALGRFDLLGDMSCHWMKSDLENNGFKADGVKARIFSVGAQGYYRAWNNGTVSICLSSESA